MSWTLRGSYLGLFASFGTLVCCVFPVLLVSLGLGATMASLAVHVPALVWLSAHKDFVFAGSGALIALAAVAQYLARNQPCPIDPALRQACLKGRFFARIALYLSFLIYAVGFSVTYLYPLIG